MPGRSNNPADARRHAVDIVRVLRDHGHIAYFAGGCVRDELLGLTPADYDVATDATPDRVRELFRKSSEVGASFGVILVHVGGGVIEVATFRADGDYSDRRRPDSVRFSSPEEDAKRRDYTINALFLDPLCGQIIDFVGGQADLAARVLRAVGDPNLRLAEDHLRALRAARLAARLGFEIEPATAAAIRRHAAELKGVSRERIGDEIERILTHPTRARGVRLLVDLGLQEPAIGVPPILRGARVAGLPPECSYAAALAAWALDLGLDATGIDGLVGQWRKALCLSNEVRAELSGILHGVVLLATTWPTLSVAAAKRAAASPWFDAALAVFAAEKPDAAHAIQARRDELAATPAGLAPPPFVTGDDLIAMGFKPGPGFRPLLDRLYDEQLEGRVTNLGDARELARRLGVKGQGLA